MRKKNRVLHNAYLLMALFLCSSCGDTPNYESGNIGNLRPITLQITSSSELDRSLWQYLSARTELLDGTRLESWCEPYSALSPPPTLGVPETDLFRVIVEIFSGVDVCSPGKGGILLARGVSIPKTATSDPLFPDTCTLQVGPAGSFIGTSRVLGGESTDLTESRLGATITPLPNGLILVIGGATLIPSPDITRADPALAPWQRAENLNTLSRSLELYDPSTGIWTPLGIESTDPKGLNVGRAYHRSILLPNRNIVAIVGGYEEGLEGEIFPSSRIDLLDLTTLTLLPDSETGKTQVPRLFASVNLIEYDEEEILFIAGGIGDDASTTYEVIFPGPAGLSENDHILGFSVLPRARWNHTATHLVSKSGVEQIYMVGGESAEGMVKLIDVFDVREKVFFEAPGTADAVAGLDTPGRLDHITLYVEALNALYIIGGFTDTQRLELTSRIEVIEVDTGIPLTLKSDLFNLVSKRAGHQATQLDEKRVLITGGVARDGTGNLIATVNDELVGPVSINPETGDDVVSAQPVPGLFHRRAGHSMVQMLNKQVLVVGGFILDETGLGALLPNASSQSSAEVYTPFPLSTP